MQTASRTHRKTKVFGALAALLIGTLVVLTLASPSLTQPVTEWTETTNYPLEIANRGAIVHDGYLYNVGGRLASAKSAQAFTASAKINSDGSLGAWTSQTPLPLGIYLHAVVASDTHLYVIGGWDNDNRLKDVYRAVFQPNGGLGNWFQISTLPVAISLHQAAIVDDNIFVTGGYITVGDKAAPVNTVYQAKISSGGVSAWSPATALPQAVYRHGMATNGNTIYVTGGYFGDPDENAPSDTTNAVYYATVNANGALGAWRAATPLPEGRYYHESVVHDGRLFVIAGTNGANFFASVISAPINADNSLGTWREETSLPTALTRFSAVSVRLFESDLIYVIGGIDNAENYRSNVYHSDVPPEPTPTPTPTATPPFVLQLKQSPNTWVEPGGQITYEIAYAGNQADALTDLTITGLIPDNVELVPGSVTTADGGVVDSSGTEPGSEIVWSWANLPADASGSVSYKVMRPIVPTPPVQLAMSIDKSGPETAAPGEEIGYTLTITNNAPIPITGIVIQDRVPTGATYVRGGTFAEGIVRWQITVLPAFETTRVDYVVTAQSTIVNSDYDVTADGGIQVKGRRTVVTTINNTPPPAGGDGMVIVNPGAVARWTSAQGLLSLPSNEVRNPEFGIYLPLVQR